MRKVGTSPRAARGSRASLAFAIAFVASAGALVVSACSSTKSHGFGDGADGGDNADAGAGFGTGGGPAGCVGIGCNVVACPGGGHTTITGKVFDPAGKNPLYNVIVYIPTDPLAALPTLTQGVSCDVCGATALNPVTSALTDETGTFTLTDVPVTAGVPIVVQVGKWRKKISFDVSTSCGENAVPDKITLPKNGSDGDMPQIAITTGGFDSLECLVLGMGVDASEFVEGPGGNGHVHLFRGEGGSVGTDANADLWSDPAKLALYDLVALSCEGKPITTNKSNLDALHTYANGGGRVFATHYQYVWFTEGQADFKGVANWTPDSMAANPLVFGIETSFPKGMSFAKWLVNVGASTAQGSIALDQVASDLTSVTSPESQAWIDNGPSAVRYFSFNTPIGAADAAQCGRVVYSDLHVSGTGGENFPGNCIPAPGKDLSPQQKALEFLFFDLSSCVQNDQTAPTPPK